MLGVAYATTSANTLGADPGVSVFSADEEELEVDREDVERGVLDTTDGELDRTAADRILKEMGYYRLEGWRESNGQWAAEVETI